MKSFRHNCNERNKSAVIKLRMKYGAAGYGVYMMLLERLADEPRLRSDLDYDMLAFDFQVDSELIRHVVEDFDLFIIDLDTDTFSHEELNHQLTSKAKREQQEKILDEFIARRINNPQWVDHQASSRDVSPERIRSIVQTSFREYILGKYVRIPEPAHLNNLLKYHLSSIPK